MTQESELWSTRRPKLRPWPSPDPERAFNERQQLALAAMTTPGGYFVWGPPGTGTSTVIASAIQIAITRGETLLLVSPTSASLVDALDALIEDDGRHAPGVLKPGVVVMDSSALDGNPGATNAVTSHPFLLDAKAAAVLARRDERLAVIAEAEQANIHHEARGRELQLRRQIHDMGPDGAGVRDLDGQLPFYQEWHALVEQRQPLRRQQDEHVAAIDAATKELTAFSGVEGRLTLLASELASERTLVNSPDMTAGAMATHEARITTLTKVLTDTVVKRDARLVIEQRLDRLRGELNQIEAAMAQCDREMAVRRRVIGDPATWAQRFQRAVSDGSLDVVREWDQRARQVKTLGDELSDLTRQRAAVEEECWRERLRLLRQAPVVATTLESLTRSDELADRRFDVVLVDGVGGVEAAKVPSAADKADRTCVLVGDFLQNAPAGDSETLPVEDAFTMAGIVDRASAERDPQCVVLSAQYGHPPVVADMVNGLCYDGLLRAAPAEPAGPESGARLAMPGGNDVVVFHDTSGLMLDFKQVDMGWRCTQTLHIAAAIAQGETGSVGFVTPDRTQADLARRLLRYETDGIECGTAHSFQGREFDAIIVDLMQDNQPHWVSYADIHGDARAVSAAKWLNVAVTRSRRRVHLIGNWEFVCASKASGMRAIAALDGRPGFGLVRY